MKDAFDRLSSRLWAHIDAYVTACGGDPEAYPSIGGDLADERLTDALRAELRAWALDSLTEALPAVCDQEGGVVSPEHGHVSGRCSYLSGHLGPHSWEPFEADDDDGDGDGDGEA